MSTTTTKLRDILRTPEGRAEVKDIIAESEDIQKQIAAALAGLISLPLTYAIWRKLGAPKWAAAALADAGTRRFVTEYKAERFRKEMLKRVPEVPR